MGKNPDAKKPFETFELVVAVLLGLGAVGASVASYQNGKWNSASSLAYGEANARTSNAAAVFNFAVTLMSSDNAMDVQARQLLLSAAAASDPLARLRDLNLINYLYKNRMSDAGQEALGVPAEYRPVNGKPQPPDMPLELIQRIQQRDLDQKYIEQMLGPANQAFGEAKKKFDEGRTAGDQGDEFSQVSLFYAVSLFITGVAMVLKSGIRWAFVSIGLVVFGYATFRLLTAPWY
ncbi:MAG: hypothetical protein KA419_00315 [Acidobacteria bacterium]|nr:hypothetical protein [Acidobacteriota bacterium]